MATTAEEVPSRHPINRCEYFKLCTRLRDSLNLFPEMFQVEDDICYCRSCSDFRGDPPVYERGEPKAKYAMPVGWVGFRLLAARARHVDAFSKWHVAFHGTTPSRVGSILATGTLLKPGETALGGQKIAIRSGDVTRIRREGTMQLLRKNLYTGETEDFEPNQVFLTPTTKYCGHPAYSSQEEVVDPLDKRKYKLSVAFQVRIRPGTYNIGQQTIGASQPIDENFSNNELEWYTKNTERGALIITGLLMRAKPVHGALSVVPTPPITMRLPLRVRAERGVSGDCDYFALCCRLRDVLGLHSSMFEVVHDFCYCDRCHHSRSDGDVYQRGDPPVKYALPREWVRYGLQAPRASQVEAYKKWHVAFHGTQAKHAKSILATGELLKPGDVALYGKPVAMRKGQARSGRTELVKHTRRNLYTNQDEVFDPDQVFMTPTIKYCAHRLYASPTVVADPETGREYHLRVAFQLRVRPGTYRVGQQTIGVPDTERVDANFSNNELEWYTDGVERGAHIITGLLLRADPV